ncbi:MAG: CRISPR-associated endoribonuclease Cas6 [Bacteroidales bacterium]|jgi:CRISPR-associated endoribonuclease Cas6|nr:CRISPR-associated endoribonuclease Cas6 [Bacteroidales bacterium]
MRFQLNLQLDKNASGDILPINYQYEQSAVIYKILSRAGGDFSEWLHDNGYGTETGRKFKLFTFSQLGVDSYRVLKQSGRLRIFSDVVRWQISFLPEISTREFIKGIFANQSFEIGDRYSSVRFLVRNITAMEPPVFTNEMTFRSLSPICIKYKPDTDTTVYLSPDDSRACPAVISDLKRRYRSFYGKDIDDESQCGFEVLDRPKSKLITIKAGTPMETRVRGYLCRFKIKAPAELMKIAYDCGVGEQGSQGFGCVEPV